MPALSDPAIMPDELRRLGQFRLLFETSRMSVLASIVGGLIPMALAIALLLGASHWFPARDWKYYLVGAVAGGLFLNGARVLMQAWRRRAQKIATFDRGFAVWRYGRLSTFEWSEVVEVDSSPAFFGFAVVCRTAAGEQKKFSFDAATDPTSSGCVVCGVRSKRSHRAPVFLPF